MFKIKPECLDQIKYYVNKCDAEISGLGLVNTENGELTVTEIFLLDQEVTGTTTDIDAGAVAKLIYDLRQKGKLDDKNFLRFWWHSHVNMGVGWSSTDDATIKEFGANDWLFAGVFNKKDESKYRFYSHNGIHYPHGYAPLDLDNVKIFSSSCAKVDALEAEYNLKVKKKTYCNPVNDYHSKDYHYKSAFGEWKNGQWVSYLDKKKDPGKDTQETDNEDQELGRFIASEFTASQAWAIMSSGSTLEELKAMFARGFTADDIYELSLGYSTGDL